MIHRPRMALKIDVLPYGATAESEAILLEPLVIEATWCRNDIITADSLEVKLPWLESGFDPRLIKSARCSFWLWDDHAEDYNESKHLRFTGIAESATRTATDLEQHVTIRFADWTTLFLASKPFPTEYVPDFADDLATAWAKICDGTGYWDREEGRIVSSVTALRNALIIDPSVRNLTIGSAVSARYHAIAKPSPPTNASAWHVWSGICQAIGAITYIDRDQCVVTTIAAHYAHENAPRFLQGHNVLELEETADHSHVRKGVLLKSYDALNRVQLEAFYPEPGDRRVKTPRSVVKRSAKGKGPITANDVAADYDVFLRYDITDQATLEQAAEEAYLIRSKQQMTGRIKTAEMRIETADRQVVDVLSLAAGDEIVVGTDIQQQWAEVADLDNTGVSIAYLTDRMGYSLGAAQLVVASITAREIAEPRYHVKSMITRLGPDHYDTEIEYESVIAIKT